MEAAEPASSALRAAAWAATSDGAGATLLAPTAPGVPGVAGALAAGLPALPLPCVALSLGLGFVGAGFCLELWRGPRGSTIVVASTVTGGLPFALGPGLELGAGADALTGGALVVLAAVEVPVVEVDGGPPPLVLGCVSGALGGPAGAGSLDGASAGEPPVDPGEPPVDPGVGGDGAPVDDPPPLPVAPAPSASAPLAENAGVRHS